MTDPEKNAQAKADAREDREAEAAMNALRDAALARVPQLSGLLMGLLTGRTKLTAHSTPDGEGGFVTEFLVVDVPEAAPDLGEPI